MLKARLFLQSNIVTSRDEAGAVQTRMLGFASAQGDTVLPANSTISIPVRGDALKFDDAQAYELNLVPSRAPAPASKS